MKHPIQAMMLGLAVALLLSCSPSGDKPAASAAAQQTAADKLDIAKQQQQEADRAMEDYTYAQKAEFVALMKKELAMVQSELDRLGAEVERSSGEKKVEAKKQLAAVRTQWTEAQKRLDEAEKASESTWKDLKHLFDVSYDEVKASYEKTRQWLSDKIAP